MMKLCVGVDVSEKELAMAYWDKDKPVFVGTYPNTDDGFDAIRGKIEDLLGATNAFVHLVMEPTGGYEQPFAHFADRQGWRVSLPNPLKPKQWESYRQKSQDRPTGCQDTGSLCLCSRPSPMEALA